MCENKENVNLYIFKNFDLYFFEIYIEYLKHNGYIQRLY
jgi:hypothetical protein